MIKYIKLGGMTMTPKQKAWAIQAEHVIKQMERRHFNAYYCSTKEEALSKALSIIEKGSVIASGGSATIEEVGLLNYIKTHSEEYTFIDRSIAKNEEEKRQIHAKAILSDYYLMSTNAFTMDGQLVNIDGKVGFTCGYNLANEYCSVAWLDYSEELLQELSSSFSWH